MRAAGVCTSRGTLAGPPTDRPSGRLAVSAMTASVGCGGPASANSCAACRTHIRGEPWSNRPPTSPSGGRLIAARIIALATVDYMARVVKRVLLASPRGYCAGVERAVDTVEQAPRPARRRPSTCASRSSTTPTSCATSRRAARSSSTTRGRCPRARRVVLSAHGVAPSVYANADARGLDTIDATCPLVTKVHVQARRYAAEGYTILLIGHAGHEEVVGTMGEAPESTILVQSVEDAEALDLPAGREGRLHHADDALGRRDRRDHHRAPPALPRDLRAEERRHLLRDLQPAVGRQGRCSARSTSCS